MPRVLIVDDQEQNRYLLEALLKSHGFDTLTAENGEDALKAARTDPPDLIVSDILMPVMDGFQLCKEWKRDVSLRHLPFIFFTATYTDPKDEVFALGLGADRFLVKPMEPDLLLEVINEILRDFHEKKNNDKKEEPDSHSFFERHNEALIRKLNDKMLQLEKANQELEREIIERKKVEIELRRLHSAIEHAAECVVTTNVQGTIEYLNPVCERILGMPREKAIGSHLESIHKEKGPQALGSKLMRKMNGGQSWEGQIADRTQEGDIMELETTISPIPDPTGDIGGYVTVMRDVTEQVKLEKQLVQSQKMEAIGTLAGGIAHDFNNLLGVIFGYTDLALLDAPKEGRLWNNLNSVQRACDRAKNLVEQILTFSRKADRERMIIDIRPIVNECGKFLRASLPSTIKIQIAWEGESNTIFGDPVQIHQVILNICTNAAHAMREKGGILELAVKKIELDEQTSTQYPDLKPGNYQMLSISDTGNGMDRETLARIFDPFFTTKATGEGTGLGLSVALGIVKNHGGAIIVYSEAGKGSTFNIYIPAMHGKPETAAEPEPEPIPTGSERVLFVDDEEDLVDIGRQILEHLGYDVVTTTSSLKALDLFRRAPDRFDLLIADQTMPDMTGAELAEEVLKIKKQMPIIICTGFSILISEDIARNIGVKKLLMKPLVAREVAQAVRSVLDGD